MNDSERGQISRSAAEVYEEFFLPALFEEWSGRVADAGEIAPGDRVLDVACGTGVLARALARRVVPGGSVVGLDSNEGMLEVARGKEPSVEWRRGRAEALPFESETFDAVVSQFGLMFFEDQGAALREMMRVLRSGGRLAVAVWGPLGESPGYAAMMELLQRLFGDTAANALRAPFALGDVRVLRSTFAAAGLPDVAVATCEGSARFPSLRSWIYTDVKGWTLADMIDEEQFERLVRAAERDLARFVAADGTVAFRCPAHVVTTRKAPHRSA
jgi:SAM-dependent methyltransferase